MFEGSREAAVRHADVVFAEMRRRHGQDGLGKAHHERSPFGLFFVGLGAVASGFIVWMLKRYPGQRLFCFAITMILGGALGNVIDRLLHGYVVDFIQVHYGGWYFPSFNVADSAITIGAGLLILDELRRVRRGR